MTPAQIAAITQIAKVLLPIIGITNPAEILPRAVKALFGDLSPSDLKAKIAFIEQDATFREAMARADATFGQ